LPLLWHRQFALMGLDWKLLFQNTYQQKGTLSVVFFGIFGIIGVPSNPSSVCLPCSRGWLCVCNSSSALSASLMSACVVQSMSALSMCLFQTESVGRKIMLICVRYENVSFWVMSSYLLTVCPFIISNI